MSRERIDQQITDCLQRGDVSGALWAVESGYGREVRAYIRSKIWHAADAEDAYADFRLAVVKGIAEFEGRSSFRTWAYVLARRAVSAATRRLRELQQTGLRSDIAVADADRAPWLQTGAQTRLRELLSMMTEEERELLVLRVQHELSYAEIAEILSSASTNALSAYACKQRFARLKHRLASLHARRISDLPSASRE